MSTIAVIGLVVLLVAVLAIVFGSVIVGVSLAAKKSREAAEKEFPDARHIDAGALFFGQKSRGATQMRGNGTLILAEAELVFKQWVTNREFRIPYRSIQSLENPRSFLGKSQGVRLLEVRFVDEAGAEDSMAWRVRDLAGSMRAIEAARADQNAAR
jgi:hypothetical protein